MDDVGAVNAGAAEEIRRLRRYAVCLALLGLTLFVWRLGSHDLWPPDEPRFGLVAREMRSGGDFSVLSLHDELYTEKPPLFFWTINAFAWLRGGEIDEWAARLPSAVSTLAALLLILQLGAWLYDARTGFLAALVFMTCLQIAIRARWASIDMMLNMFVLAAIVLLWRGCLRTTGPTARWSIRLAWIMMGLGTLAKGPVALVLPLLAVLPSLLIARDAAAVRRLFGPTGPLFYLAVTLSWFALFARRIGLESAIGILNRQTVERYADAWHQQHPLWFYLWRFPAGFIPWILFLPPAIRLAWREGTGNPERRRATLFLCTWIAAIALFFSFATGKRGVYIIPLYPAAALIVGRLLARAIGKDDPEAAPERAAVLWPFAGWAGITAVLLVVLPVAALRRHPSLMVPGIAMAIVLCGGAFGGLLKLRRTRAAAALAWLTGSLVVTLLLCVGMVLPLENRYKNIRGFAEQVRPHLEAGAAFGATETRRDAWVFYTGRFAEMLDSPASVIDYLARDGPGYLLIDGATLERVRGLLPGGVSEVMRGSVEDETYYLLRRGVGP